MSKYWTVVNLTPSTKLYDSYHQAQESLYETFVFDEACYNFYIVAKIENVVKLKSQKVTVSGTTLEDFFNVYENTKR